MIRKELNYFYQTVFYKLDQMTGENHFLIVDENSPGVIVHSNSFEIYLFYVHNYVTL